jgi:hypothetical protein
MPKYVPRLKGIMRRECIMPSNLGGVNFHNSMPAMNYFDSNRTNTVIVNLS